MGICPMEHCLMGICLMEPHMEDLSLNKCKAILLDMCEQLYKTCMLKHCS